MKQGTSIKIDINNISSRTVPKKGKSNQGLNEESSKIGNSSTDRVCTMVNEFKENSKDEPNSARTAVIPVKGTSCNLLNKDKQKNDVSLMSVRKDENQSCTTKGVDFGDEDRKILYITWLNEINKNINIEKWNFINIDNFIEKHYSYKGEYGIDYNIEEIQWITFQASKIISALPTLLEIDSPVIICGDIHGQIQDLKNIFHKFGKPPSKQYLFLGDYVDRGDNSLEVILMLLALKIKYPSSIHLLRGNHELKHINRVYGFREEINERITDPFLDENIYEEFNRLFAYFPLAACVYKKILCMHGGISEKIQSLNCIRDIKRPLETVNNIAADLLWADPDRKTPHYSHNSARGISYTFGIAALEKFCKDLGIDLIIRGHQVCRIGYELFGNGRLITVFSASDYDAEIKNLAGVVVINKDFYAYPVSIKCPKREREKAKQFRKGKKGITTDETN
uniref:Serine/threonine-protein phosphatase n=1 Tax=Parastrongyloides trichosuri TaxID=131310 RepID=A0A0N4ZUY9_PARTI